MVRRKMILPIHYADERIWKSIEAELDNSEKLRALTTYEADDQIWDTIDRELNNEPKSSTRIWFKIAASLLFIVACAFLFNILNPYIENKKSVELSYFEEWIEVSNLTNWNLENEEEIDHLIKLKELESPELIYSQEFQFLKAEYYALSDAKQDLIKELNPYSDNQDLELILTKIELEQGSIARSLISYRIS